MPKQTIKRTMDQRRALIAECKRRMQAGEAIKDICAGLQIPEKTFQKWAKIHGFRLGDINPDHPRARARMPTGPSDKTSSGLYMRGASLPRPEGSGRKPALSREEAAHFKAHPAEAHLEALRARDREDWARVDAISKLMKQEKSRAGDIDKLKQLAMKDPNYDWGAYMHECMERWEDDEMLARATFALARDLDRSLTEPPIHTRAPQEWIDHYLALADLPLDELRDAILQARDAPEMPGPFDRMGKDVDT